MAHMLESSCHFDGGTGVLRGDQIMSNNDKGATPRTDEECQRGEHSMVERLKVPTEFARTLEREADETKSALIGARVLIEEFRAAHEASQARAARLEEALKYWLPVEVPMQGLGDHDPKLIAHRKKWHEAKVALAEFPNSWLQERLKAERERCAKAIEGRFGGESRITYARASEAGAATIRALPEGE